MQKIRLALNVFNNLFLSLQHSKTNYKGKDTEMSAAIKNRTRDEIIAAFRESIRRKQEWQEHANETIQRIRQERQQLSI